MSTYHNSKVDKKMANVKEKITLPRYRYKRPDKQLYVPRALRKSDIENTMDKKDVNTINKVSVKCFQATYVVPKMQKVENNSTLLKQIPKCVKCPKMNNSDVDETPNVEKSKMSLLIVKNSDEKQATEYVSDRDSNLFLNDDEQYVRDMDQIHDTLKFHIDLKKSIKSSAKKSIISSDKMDLEDLILTNNAKTAEFKSEVLQTSTENFCNPVNVLKVEDDPSLKSQSKKSNKKNSNISSIKMNLECVGISTNNAKKIELNNKVEQNSNENYSNPVNVVKLRVEDCSFLKNQSIKSSKKNSNTSCVKMNLEDVGILVNNEKETELHNEVLRNPNQNYFNPVNVIKLKAEDESSSEKPEDSWETKFNDDGDCLDPEFIRELCDVTGQIHLAIAKSDYSNYQPVLKNTAEEFENVVELYGFPVEFSTQDLTSAFSSFQEASYNIKWVDDCHALAIFSTPAIACQALHLSHPFIKVRPVSEGIKESKEKARFYARMHEAHKPRPVTSAVLARRLVSGALGLRVKTSKEQRDTERNILKEAKEKKRLKARQQQDIWNGIVS